MMLAEMLVGHMAGDYLVQNDWMALGKSKKALPLLVHCTLYTMAVWASTLFALPTHLVITVFVSHVLIDGWYLTYDFSDCCHERDIQRGGIVDWWMCLIGQSGFKKNLAPWARILVDNSMHVVVLWAVAILN